VIDCLCECQALTLGERSLIEDKVKIAILKGVNCRGMFGVLIGIISGVTTGHLSTGRSGGVSMAIAGDVGFSILNIRRLDN
jgi:hypothetical protein